MESLSSAETKSQEIPQTEPKNSLPNSPKTPILSNPQMSLLNNQCSNSFQGRIIGEATITSYEKVLKILNNIKSHLESLGTNKQMITDLQWVVQKIQTHTLYTYELTEENLTGSMDQSEVKSFLGYLNDFSEVKTTGPKRKEARVKTQKTEIKKSKSMFKQKTMFNKEKAKPIIDLDEEEDPFFEVCKQIGEIDFNIFDFESKVKTENVMPLIGKYVINNTNTAGLLELKNLDKFLTTVRNGYNDVPYHSSVHGADVCQTVFIMITKSNLQEALGLSSHDIVSLLVSSLLHDIGHPGLNNTYQMNSLSDHAIYYNDKSVLENFHTAEGFKILRKEECNIFSKFDAQQYKNMRKRIIELILSTDMVLHAKAMSLVKNKINMYNIVSGKNVESILSESNNVFEDQQEIMNFVIHTSDISHSAKNFEVSLKWTNKIMDEFWNQGDLEKMQGLDVSFLCDRNNCDVPKNQIVFIKGIILPNFEVLIEMFPGLAHFKTNIEANINNWVQLYDASKK